MTLLTHDQIDDIISLGTPEFPDTPASTASTGFSSTTSTVTPKPDLSELSSFELKLLNKKLKRKLKYKMKMGKKKKLKAELRCTKPFNANIPSVFKLVDIKNYQFISRVELEEISKTIKVPIKPEEVKPNTVPQSESNRPIKVPEEAIPKPKPKPIVSSEDNIDDKEKEKKKDNNVTVIKEQRQKIDPGFACSRQYWKDLKQYNFENHTRRFVQFVIPIGPNSPKILCYNLKHNIGNHSLPGGSLKYDEDEKNGLRRIWNEIFKTPDDDHVKDVEFIQLLNTWYRPEYDVNVYPYELRNSTVKEIIKVYLVKLPETGKLGFSGFYESLVPLCFYDLYDKSDPQIKDIPLLLSNNRFE